MASGTTSNLGLSRRANALLVEAMGQPEELRWRFVAEQCQDDGFLRAQVESAMGADTSVLRSLEGSLEQLHEPMGGALGPGERVGAYEIIEEIGRGGWGVVYLAQRADGEFERQVALKVLQRGLHGVEAVRRFHTERQILAQFQHPNIAQLYEGGTTEDRRPYLVMEHVVGQPIDRFCDARRLDLGARLSLFSKVCGAVQVAHQSLVVHRDLKPSNILVDESGEPKLLDFGIAKLLAEGVQRSASAQEPRSRLMTPEYASPEQIRGEAITTASDVYSLGVLLYRLLTGRSPYPGASSLQEVNLAVCTARPPLASRILAEQAPAEGEDGAQGDEVEMSTRALRRRSRALRGDLDAILAQALAKEPTDRYPSVDSLARDLRSYASGYPVVARGGSALYRGGKFLRRNLGAALATVLVTGLALGYAVDRHQQQKRTEAQRLRAEKVSAFLVDLFDLSELSRDKGRTVRALDVLDMAHTKIDEEIVDEPALQAALRLTIGMGYRDLGEVEPAEELLRQSLASRRADPQTTPLELAENLMALGQLQIQRGSYAEGRRLYSEAIAINRSLLSSDEDRRAAINGISRTALVLMAAGQAEENFPILLEVLEATTEFEGDEIKLAASIEGNIALTFYHRARYEEAEYWLWRALENSLRVLHPDHAQVAAERSNLATVLKRIGRPEEAAVLYLEVEQSYYRRLGQSHPALARVLNHQAEAMLHRGELEVAERLARRATTMWRNEKGDDDLSWPAVHSVHCTILRLQSRLEEAETLARDALRLSEEVLGRESRAAADARLDLARVLLAQDKVAEAVSEARLATEALRGPFSVDSQEVALAEAVLGAGLARLGEHAEARTLLERSAPLVRKSVGPLDPRSREAEAALQALPRALPAGV